MPERVYRINYLLRTGHDEREHYKCAVSAESCAEAYERGWNHITRCVQTEHYRQIDYAGMSWDAHPRDMQDYCNAHYSEADSSMKIYSEKPHKSPDHRFMMSDAARNELMHMNWGGKIKIEIMASEMKDVMKLYPPDCFLELEWAENAVSALEKNGDFEAAGYLLRTKITTFNEVASFFDSHKKYSDTLKGVDDFMSRLQKYNNDVVLKTQGRDASPSVGKNL